jgi:hypothetical protein
MLSNVVSYKRTSSLMFQCIVSILWVLVIFWCLYVKCVYYVGGCLLLKICACYSLQMVGNVAFYASYDNIQNWIGIREEGEVNNTEACIANDETSWWIMNRCSTSYIAFPYVSRLYERRADRNVWRGVGISSEGMLQCVVSLTDLCLLQVTIIFNYAPGI